MSSMDSQLPACVTAAGSPRQHASGSKPAVVSLLSDDDDDDVGDGDGDRAMPDMGGLLPETQPWGLAPSQPHSSQSTQSQSHSRHRLLTPGGGANSNTALQRSAGTCAGQGAIDLSSPPRKSAAGHAPGAGVGVSQTRVAISGREGLGGDSTCPRELRGNPPHAGEGGNVGGGGGGSSDDAGVAMLVDMGFNADQAAKVCDLAPLWRASPDPLAERSIAQTLLARSTYANGPCVVIAYYSLVRVLC